MESAERCVGCKACELACSESRSKRGGEGAASIRVAGSEQEGGYRVLHCSLCEEVACVRVCPGDALTRQKETGIVSLDESKCSGCGSCVFSCPFEIIHLGGPRGLAQPCDLCEGAPECVKACGNSALEIVELT